MILKELSDFLKKNEKENCLKLLFIWLEKNLKKPSLDNVSKILQNEIYLAKNKNNSTLFIAKSKTGRKLLIALYNFSTSFEHYKISKIKYLEQKKKKNK